MHTFTDLGLEVLESDAASRRIRLAEQTVAILELGGGFGQKDLDAYFRGLGMPTPNITAVGVDGGANRPGQDPEGADGEVMHDGPDSATGGGFSDVFPSRPWQSIVTAHAKHKP